MREQGDRDTERPRDRETETSPAQPSQPAQPSPASQTGNQVTNQSANQPANTHHATMQLLGEADGAEPLDALSELLKRAVLEQFLKG